MFLVTRTIPPITIKSNPAPKRIPGRSSPVYARLRAVETDGVAVGEALGLDATGGYPGEIGADVGPESELPVGWGVTTGDSAEGVPGVPVGVGVTVAGGVVGGVVGVVVVGVGSGVTGGVLGSGLAVVVGDGGIVGAGVVGDDGSSVGSGVSVTGGVTTGVGSGVTTGGVVATGHG